MDVTILGAGEVGRHLAQALIGDGYDVKLIDADPDAVRAARELLDIEVLLGHGGSVDVLERAGVADGDLFCAVTNNDELNMLASLLSKKLGVDHTAVRINGLSHITSKRFLYKKTLDFDLTISPEEMTAAAISRLVRGQDSVSVESVAEGRLQLHRFELSGRFEAVGRKIKDVKLPKECLITAVFRGTSILIPSGEDEVLEGDEILLIGPSETIERVDKIVGGRIHLPRRVAIVGGGRHGLAAAQTLERLRIKVKLLEIRRERAEEIADVLENSEVVHADGTNLHHLVEENIESTDLFLALTATDEFNLISCQLARQVGARMTAAMVSKADYQDLYKQLEINAVISPRTLVAERILRFVRSGCRARITSIEHGRAEVLEMEVEETSPIAGQRLRDVTFPRGALVGAVIRGEKNFVPGGSDVLEVGDIVIVFALSQARIDVEKLF